MSVRPEGPAGPEQPAGSRPGLDPDDVPSDGDGVSTHPGGEPSGNPLDPVARPGVDLSQVPHTGSRPPESGEVAPHPAVVEPGENDEDDGVEGAGGAPQAGHAAPEEEGVDQDGAPDVDADPGDTASLEPGGGVEPGDTPPSSGGTATSLAPQEKEKGGRSRLLVPIIILAVLALLFVAFFGGQLLSFF